MPCADGSGSTMQALNIRKQKPYKREGVSGIGANLPKV